ncbi:attractin-like protein 1 isoform X2 [Salminus brasiliensis]|uniref:attractin-like protein 1 isoform X2 n=1 Tax=Salminus brasiliensis TaxID=930266 RepID=UPI003B836038
MSFRTEMKSSSFSAGVFQDGLWLRRGLWTLFCCRLFLCTGALLPGTCEQRCFSGSCVNGTCLCDHGWVGDQCQHCQGRSRLTEPSGSLTDGPVNYKDKTKCTWLIEGYPEAVLRLRFNHYATECGWDHMYVFDGDSIYAPLVAVFSGLVVPETEGNRTVPEVVTTSGFALLHFFSDAAYNLTGFDVVYSINSCPNNCSAHGRCVAGDSKSSSVRCECDVYWKGEACDFPYCWNNCGSPDRGYCDLTGEKLCICNNSWQGPDCSIPDPSDEPYWFLPNIRPDARSLVRTSHKAVVQGELMWVIGGYNFNYNSFQMVINYNLENNSWDMVTSDSGPVQRYGHTLALYQDDIYMFGGKLEGISGNVTDELWVFNTQSRSWILRTPTVVALAQLYAVEGHTAHIVEMSHGEPVMIVLFGYSPIYSYVSHIQQYSLRTNSWLIVETRGARVQGGYGHSSVYDGSSHSLYVHGGYKALSFNKYGLVDHLYCYDVHTRTWFILKESGLARYLHSAVLISGAVLVFGGNTHNDTSISSGAKCFSSDFLSYDIACDEWTVLPKPDLYHDVSRFGHTAVVSNRSMYVFGGFSSVIHSDMLVYKSASCEAFTEQQLCQHAGPGIRCEWVRGECVPWDSHRADRKPSDIFCPDRSNATDEQCLHYSNCPTCTANTKGCQWCEDKTCISASSSCTQSVQNFTECRFRSEQTCNELTNCRSCSINIHCQWEPQMQECHAMPGQLCGEGWSLVDAACLRLNPSRDSYDNAQHYCKNLNGNIASLTSANQLDFILEEMQRYSFEKQLSPWVGLRKINISYWGWEDLSPFTNSTLHWLQGEPSDSGFCVHLEKAEVVGLRSKPCTAKTDGLVCEKPIASPNPSALPCTMPCSLRSTCDDCTSQATGCVWCSNTERCVDSNAYVVSFPYGQCLEWKTGDCRFQNCSGLQSCAECLEQLACGWCGDPSMTGQGRCVEGSYRGPVKRPNKQSHEMMLDASLCPRERGYDWVFIQCPACQCNGHSTCVNTSVCEQCMNFTTGPHCQSCLPGYYGDPTNGGKCQACRCNGHSNSCHAASGKCYCTTKGVKGDQCQLCDSMNRYLGNPLRGTCYYNLLIDYHFTFSLLQEDDQQYTAINFMASPDQSSKNLEMFINASHSFSLNITWSIGSTAGTVLSEEFSIVSKSNIKDFQNTFSCEGFSFRANPNITFYIYVSNFSWPIKIQISFSQHSSVMDLIQFFVTFFSCFLSLLLVAAVIWKIKQTFWASRRREELTRERRQMASRPFASVPVSLEVTEEGKEEEELLKDQVETLPSPIVIERSPECPHLASLASPQPAPLLIPHSRSQGTSKIRAWA